jgi:hypothetical protein
VCSPQELSNLFYRQLCLRIGAYRATPGYGGLE